MWKRYIVQLTDLEREELRALTTKGSTRLRKLERAQIH